MNQTTDKIAEMMYKVGSMDCIETPSGKKALWTPENCALHKLICKELANIYEEEELCNNCGCPFKSHYSDDGGQSEHCECGKCGEFEPTDDFNPKKFLKKCGMEGGK